MTARATPHTGATSVLHRPQRPKGVSGHDQQQHDSTRDAVILAHGTSRQSVGYGVHSTDKMYGGGGWRASTVLLGVGDAESIK